MNEASTHNASKWNARHAYAKHQTVSESLILTLMKERLPTSGSALDLACGRGGNALALASMGFAVHAWDISDQAIDCVNESAMQLGLEHHIHAQVRDVVAQPPEPSQFDVVIVSRFLERQLCPAIALSLRPNGWLLYQTFTKGLNNPNYLLQPYELQSLFASLELHWYSEQAETTGGMAESLLVARQTGKIYESN